MTSEACRPLAYRSCSGQHHGLLAPEIPQRLLDLHHRGHRRGIGAVGVQHDGDGEFTEERVLRHCQELLAGGHVASPDPHGGVVEILGTAGEDAAVNEIADVAFGHTTVAQHDIGGGIIGHDLIENARQPRTVELKQELAHRGSHLGGL